MPNPNSEEFAYVKKLINKAKMEETLEIIKKFAWRAWILSNRGDFDKALKIALNCKELLSKIGSQN